jgi:hypothetical protein
VVIVEIVSHVRLRIVEIADGGCQLLPPSPNACRSLV